MPRLTAPPPSYKVYAMSIFSEITKGNILSIKTAFIPAEGVGAPISPASYADAGAGWAEHAPVVTLEGVTGEMGGCATISSVGSEATRAENALWGLRATLGLPGIVLTETNEAILTNIVEKACVKHNIEGDPTVHAGFIRTQMGVSDGNVSSWTIPHRHVDGIIRLATDPTTGKEVWSGGDLYHALISSSAQNPLWLANHSPNSLLYGFWLSAGAPLLHKHQRMVTNSISAYGATILHSGATKISPLPTSAATTWGRNKNGVLEELKKGSRASELLLGSVPASDTKKVVATSIIGSGSVAISGLRRLERCGADPLLTESLVALAVLGLRLNADESIIRSGTTLLPTETRYGLHGGDNDTAAGLADMPTNEMITIVADTLARARDKGAIGGSSDNVFVELSPSLCAVAVDAYVKQLKK